MPCLSAGSCSHGTASSAPLKCVVDQPTMNDMALTGFLISPASSLFPPALTYDAIHLHRRSYSNQRTLGTFSGSWTS